MYLVNSALMLDTMHFTLAQNYKHPGIFFLLIQAYFDIWISICILGGKLNYSISPVIYNMHLIQINI